MQLIYHYYHSGCSSSETCTLGATSACLYGSPIQLFSCNVRIFVWLTVHHLEKLSQTINLMTAAILPSCWEVVESLLGMDWRWSKKTRLKNMKNSTILDVSVLVFDIQLVYLCAVTTYVWVSCSHGDTIFPNSERSLCITWNQQAWKKTNVFFHRYTSICQLVMGQELMVFCGYITYIRKVIIIVLFVFYIQENNLWCKFKFSF